MKWHGMELSLEPRVRRPVRSSFHQITNFTFSLHSNLSTLSLLPDRFHLRPVASLHEPSVDKEDAGSLGAGWGDISRIMGNE